MICLNVTFNWLTPRDQAIYDYLKNHAKYATTTQLAEMFFKEKIDKQEPIKNAKAICRRRMAALERYIPEITSFYRQANSDRIYTVIPPKEYIAALAKIDHSLALNSLYMEIKRHATARGHEIQDFKIEAATKGDFIPDLLLVYVINGKRKIYFLEYDTGTEHMPQIKKKVDKYNKYCAQQAFLTEDWQPSNLRPELCFVTLKEERAVKIQKMGISACTDVKQILSFGGNT